MSKGILDFFDVTPSASFDVPSEEAVAYFKSKGLGASFSYADLIAEEQALAFTIAKMMDIDLLKDVRESLEVALNEGIAFRDWADQITPLLQQKGWWGRKAVVDPVSGQTVVAQLGSPGRLQTIFRTNMASSYAAGTWQQISDQAEDAPFLMYDAVDDFRTREQHALWDDKVLPHNHSWWKTHYPPNGYNCRCCVIQLDADDMEQLGLEVSKAPKDGTFEWTNPRTGKVERIPNGIDPGFNYNVGQAREKKMKGLLDEKISTLLDDEQDAVRGSL